MQIHSVIFIREQEAQLTGSACCGRLEGDFLGCVAGRVFPERRAAMEAMGPLYRAVRDRYGEEVAIDVVDPRNAVALTLLLVRDFRRFRVGLRSALRTLARIPVQAVIVDGRLMAAGAWPSSDEVIRAIDGAAGSRLPTASRA